MHEVSQEEQVLSGKAADLARIAHLPHGTISKRRLPVEGDAHWWPVTGYSHDLWMWSCPKGPDQGSTPTHQACLCRAIPTMDGLLPGFSEWGAWLEGGLCPSWVLEQRPVRSQSRSRALHTAYVRPSLLHASGMGSRGTRSERRLCSMGHHEACEHSPVLLVQRG